MDLLFFHRSLRCLVVIDLKIGSFTHADAGQMHFYLNYAREHWVREGENPPVGLILCSEKDETLAQYALEGLSNKVMAAEYRITLPDETVLAAELDRTRQAMEHRGHLSCSSLTHPLPLSSRRPSVSFGGFGLRHGPPRVQGSRVSTLAFVCLAQHRRVQGPRWVHRLPCTSGRWCCLPSKRVSVVLPTVTSSQVV